MAKLVILRPCGRAADPCGDPGIHCTGDLAHELEVLGRVSQGFHTHTKKDIILGTLFNMFGVLWVSLSSETLDFEKHRRKTDGFGDKKRARIEKRPLPEKKQK